MSKIYFVTIIHKKIVILAMFTGFSFFEIKLIDVDKFVYNRCKTTEENIWKTVIVRYIFSLQLRAEIFTNYVLKSKASG